MNIVPFVAEIEPLKLTDVITAAGTLLALGLSVFALFWQRQLLEKQLKHELYEKRLAIYIRYKQALGVTDLSGIDISVSSNMIQAVLTQNAFEFEIRCLFGERASELLRQIHALCWKISENTEAIKKRREEENLTEDQIKPLALEALAPIQEAAMLWIECGELLEEQLKLYNDPIRKRALWWSKAKLKNPAAQ